MSTFSYEDMSWSDIRDLFRKWREDNERKSDDVIQLWEAVLEDKVQKTGNERPLILEQVVVAAFDTARFDIATKCIKELSLEFPGSMRVMKLKAMRLEALERYDEAIDVLDAIISKDETNAAPRKRKIAILKAKGQRTEAIKELTDYLKSFMSDQEAWHELCNLYLAEGEYGKAVFCMEEVLLHNPHSHLVHQRIAEIRYTMGGVENIEVAKTYYIQAIKLNPKNMRALYGLYLCNKFIVNSRALGSRRKEAQELAKWAFLMAALRTKLSPEDNEDDLGLVTNLKYCDGCEIKSEL